MKVNKAEVPFVPVTLTFETRDELVAICTALQIALLHWANCSDIGVLNRYVEPVNEALGLLRGV